jgi:hypothetical protein
MQIFSGVGRKYLKELLIGDIFSHIEVFQQNIPQ